MSVYIKGWVTMHLQASSSPLSTEVKPNSPLQLFTTLHPPVNPPHDVLCCCSLPLCNVLPFYVCYIDHTVTTTVTNVHGEQVKFSASANKCHHMTL